MTAARWLAICSFALGACQGASADPGLDALLRVEGAQFEPGELPPGSSGPAIRNLQLTHNTLEIGTRRERLTGTLDPEASAVAVMREDDAGYWIVTAGLPSVAEPELPTLSGMLALSLETPDGPFVLLARAVDRRGRFGKLQRIELTARSTTLDAELVVRLRWNTKADLDLHVIDPDGVEIWSRNINSWQPPAPGEPLADPDAWRSGGLLDFDSNAQCVFDGRCEEQVYWRDDPPRGDYRVQVATASLCGDASAHWAIEAHLGSELVGAARGISVAPDTRKQSAAGAGLQALAFAVR